MGGFERTHEPNFDGDARARADGELEDAAPSYAKVEDFANTNTRKTKASDLPFLVGQLKDDDKKRVGDLIPKLATKVSGDIMLEVCSLVRDPIYFTIKAATTAKPPVAEKSLRRYLRSRPVDVIARLDQDVEVFAKIQELLPGALGVELPQLADLPAAIHGSELFVSWFIRKTESRTVAALTLARNGSATLGATLQALGEWGWLDDIDISAKSEIHLGLTSLRRSAKGAAASKLDLMIANLTRFEAEEAKAELTTQLEVGSNDTRMLNAAGAADSLEHQPIDKVVARLKGQPADKVLQFLIATRPAPVQAFELLAGATSVTGEHVRALLLQYHSDQTPAAFTNAKVRKLIRTKVGTKTPLVHLIPTTHRDTLQLVVLHDEALRQWAYEDNDPLTLLWLAAGGLGSTAREGCQVIRDEKGFNWVHRLPADADALSLRRFVLNCSNPEAVKYVRERLLHDGKYVYDEAADRATEIDPVTYGAGDLARLHVTENGATPDPEAVLARLADMTAADRIALVKQPHEVKAILDDVEDRNRVRAVFLLGPTLSELLAMPVGFEPGLLAYFATRPASEETVVVAKPTLTDAARTIVGNLSPFVAFPSLDQPAALAAALAANHKLLGWIFENTETSFVLAMLSRDPVKTVAAQQLASQAHFYDRFPAFKHLLPEGKRGLDALEKEAKRTAEDDEARRGIDSDLRRTVQWRVMLSRKIAGSACTMRPVPARSGTRSQRSGPLTAGPPRSRSCVARRQRNRSSSSMAVIRRSSAS